MTDSFWFCKKLDIQGLSKKAKAARDGYDSMIERIISEHEEARRMKKEAVGKIRVSFPQINKSYYSYE